MTIEVVKEDDILAIESVEAAEDITIVELGSGEFEIQASIEVREKYTHRTFVRTFVISRDQMKEIGEWIMGRLK